ncbi:MAG: hypothetical protein COU28_02040 [Candidatus Magasanikbacteria bacterium CG10_big_fil_rev_8_21_14_0_10_36_16]|uniref:DUF3784 domain-containing protein n=1 Tax=Candidatus Magasanikbacteria bacterium CG10_big_fil_rev_8_21_14_0_10_36_16 TaxID=1974645 RepID=A0A2H0TYQ1_9BACT|nr:MAG: hypothetical protein COU28_02040 [Candidatus Magasanikbacteria bacterium CG10_big_fil_rev_8_21_14_0_10_36_16]
MNYVWGILIIALGAVMVIKTDWFVENFGHSEWAEEHLGGGGTRLMYKILGIVAIILSLMGMTGLLGSVIVKVFGRLFGI